MSSTSPTPADTSRFDPLEILREEAIAAATAHGAERCEELADSLVRRYLQRTAGFSVYVRSRRLSVRQEVARLHNGRNTAEVARALGITPRYVQMLVQQRKKPA